MHIEKYMQTAKKMKDLKCMPQTKSINSIKSKWLKKIIDWNMYCELKANEQELGDRNKPNKLLARKRKEVRNNNE
jgi:hypothetical protein